MYLAKGWKWRDISVARIGRVSPQEAIMKALFHTMFLVLCLAGAAGTASAAKSVTTQNPCSICATFGPGDSAKTARKISFKTPTKGKAVVTFHGVLYCVSNRTAVTEFIFDTQIVAKGEPMANDGPSALALATSVEPYDGNSRVVTFNLASTRVFSIPAAGKYEYKFKVAPFGLQPSTGCDVRRGALTIQFSS